MYASVRRYQLKPGTEAEIIERAREGFVPIISEDPGFVAYYIVDAGDGAVATISIFEEKNSADVSNTMAADWIRRHLSELFAGSPEVVTGEVVVERRRQEERLSQASSV